MNKYIAVGKNLRSSAQKAKIPADIVRGMTVVDAMPILEYMNKKAAGQVLEVIRSAKANAIHNFDAKENNLVISEIRVDKGLEYKRMKPRSRGNSSTYKLHHCTVTVILQDVTESVDEVKTAKKTKKVVKAETKKEETKKDEKVKVKKSVKETKKASA